MSENKQETVSMSENELMENDKESNITKDKIFSRISTQNLESFTDAADAADAEAKEKSCDDSSGVFNTRMDENTAPIDPFTKEQGKNDYPFQKESDTHESITRDKSEEDLNENSISDVLRVDPPQDLRSKPHDGVGLPPTDDSKHVSKSRFAHSDGTSTDLKQRYSIENSPDDNDTDQKRDEYVRAGTRIRSILSNTLSHIADRFLAVIEEETKTRNDEQKLLSSSRDKRKRSEANSPEFDQHSRPFQLTREEVNYGTIHSGIDERFLDNKHATELAREKTIEVFALKRVRIHSEQQN